MDAVENKDKQVDRMTREFLTLLFGKHLEKHGGFINIRLITPTEEYKTAPTPKVRENIFTPNIEEVVANRYGWNALDTRNGRTYGNNVFFGVAPRARKDGTKDGVDYLTNLWLDIDYGEIGHKHSEFKTKEEAEQFIWGIDPRPSVITHSGGGFQLFWVLKESERIRDIGAVERITRGMIAHFKGDVGTGDLARIFRLPGTINPKHPDYPRPCEVVELHPDLVYDFEAFRQFALEEAIPTVRPQVHTKDNTAGTSAPRPENHLKFNPISKEELQSRGILGKMLNIITTGSCQDYPETKRSGRDQAVILHLVGKGLENDTIKRVFLSFPVGDKYRERCQESREKAADDYLTGNIKNAEKYIIEHPQEYQRITGVTIPAKTNAILNIALKEKVLKPEMMLTSEKVEQLSKKILNFEGLTKEDGTNCLTYERKTPNEYVFYAILKDHADPGERIDLEMMRRTYAGLVALAFEARSFILEDVKVTPLANLITKGEAGGKEKKAVRVAINRLGSTHYKIITPGTRTVASLLWLQYKNKRLTVNLNPWYLEGLDLDTGIISPPYTTIPLAIPNLTNMERYKEIARDYFKYKLAYQHKTRIMSLLVKTVFVKVLQISDSELKRLKKRVEIWEDCILPAIGEAGLRAAKIGVQKQGKNKDPLYFVLRLVKKGNRKVKKGIFAKKRGIFAKNFEG